MKIQAMVLVLLTSLTPIAGSDQITGQVVDSVSGDIEWEDEPFFGKIELLDINGDGVPEILTENPGNGPMKVFDASYRSEVRFQ